MKMFTGKRLWQKLLIALLLVVLLFQFIMPPKSYGFGLDDIPEFFADLGNRILWGIIRAPSALGDVVMSAMNNFMLGTNGLGTAMISNEAIGNESWFNQGTEGIEDGGDSTQEVSVGEDDDKIVLYVDQSFFQDDDGKEHYPWNGSDSWEIPNLLYCPENIFGNNIAMLDVNFLNPNKYTSVIGNGGNSTAGTNNYAADRALNSKNISVASKLHDTVVSWYKAFRNIAIVVLLSILVYLGIRILISSTAEDKAKYKETIKDWAIALCLVFAMHFIMSAIIMIVNQVNKLFVGVNRNVFIHINGANITFRSNFTGVMRFLAQSGSRADTIAYTVIYLVLVFYTISFTIQYLKRVLYIAFYTMISPLVAITYPMDKLGDGKSQAFNKWFKEYVMTMALQPIHLIVYTMIVSSAMALAIENPLFAIVAIGFLIPAEQFIKGLFGVEAKADGFKGFTSGVLASKALDMMKKPVTPPKNAQGNGAGGSGEETPTIKQASNKRLDAFKTQGGNQETQENPRLAQSNVGTEEGENPRLGAGNAGAGMGTGDAGDMAGAAMAGGAAAAMMSSTPNDSTQQQAMPDTVQQSSLPEADEQQTHQQTQQQNQQSAQQNESGMSQEEAKKRGLLGRGVSALGKGIIHPRRTIKGIANKIDRKIPNYEKRKIKKAVKNKYKGKLRKVRGTPVRSLAKFAARTGLKASGMAIAGTIGMAAGIASGKGLSGAASGLVAGAATGNIIGKNVYDGVAKIGTTASNTYNRNQQTREILRNMKAEQIKRTEGEAAAIAYAKSHLSKSQRNRYDDLLSQYTAQTGEIINQDKDKLYSSLYDYESKGVTDTDKILQGLQMEYSDKYQDLRDKVGLKAGDEDSHKKAVDAMELTNTYGKDYLLNDKKYEEFNNELTSNGIKDKNQRDNIKRMFGAATGVDYDSVEAERQARAAQAAQREQQTQQQTPRRGRPRRDSTGTTELENPNDSNNNQS